VLRSELTLPFSFSPAQRQPANPLIGQADRGSTMVFAGLTDLSLRRSWEAASGHGAVPAGREENGPLGDGKAIISGRVGGRSSQRAYVILRMVLAVETGQCRSMSRSKICEIKALSFKALIILTYWNRLIIDS
jgi:hypothetical protein